MQGQGKHIVVGSDGAAFATARAAKERGYDSLVLVPRGAPSVRLIPSDIHARDLDLRERGALARGFKDATIVHYCAGTAMLPIDEDEPERLKQIVDGVREAGAKFVYCDAPYAYGVAGRAMSEEMPQRARDPLGGFLTALAQFVVHSHRMGQITAVIARHGDLIGPQVVRSPFGEAFIKAVLGKRPVTVLGRSTTPRSLTYSPDLGRALVLLSEQEETWGQIWHVPSTAPVSPEKLINAIRATQDLAPIPRKAIHEIRSRGPVFGIGAARDKAQRRLARDYESRFALSSAKFERAFAMHATGLKEILAETIEALSLVAVS
jgi:nucleoside-diphosphate-sugar epimerase